MIRVAQIRLTLVYMAGVTVVMAAFSIALYLALQTQIKISVQQELQVADLGSIRPQIERSILDEETSRIRLVLFGVNVAGLTLTAGICFVVAGRALRPVEIAMSRQRQFTAHASHELRTPLTVIAGEVDVELERERSPDEYRRVLRVIREEVDRLDATVTQLLTMASIQSETIPLHRSMRPVHEALDSVIAPVASRLAPDITLRTEIPANMEADLDWPKIQQLLGNLLDNAVQHTPPGGTIRIDVRNRGIDLELSVLNSGPRIDPEDLPHIFVPFFRGRDQMHREGTGLGLALCDGIARAHGGKLTALNTPEGVRIEARFPANLNHGKK